MRTTTLVLCAVMTFPMAVAAQARAPRNAVTVPSGPFTMGSSKGAPDEQPVRKVTVSAMEIDRHEVSNARYRQCVGAGICSPPALPVSHTRPHYFDDPRFDEYPVIFVSWHQADHYCRFAGGRLPTEAEWEKAARGTSDAREYPWGDEAPDCRRANMGGAKPCVGDTDRIGQRPAGASPCGAQDMAGNVWEWTQDWYAPDAYSSGATNDPKGPANGTLKVMRGGCWESGASSLRVSCRKAELPAAWADNVGFRCVWPAGGAR
jgi:eukaryotic-like serine/threonine-protein kinase